MVNHDLCKGLIIGGLIGAGLGILYAPKSGKELREDIGDAAEELYGKTREQYNQARKTIEEVTRSGKALYAGEKERLKEAIEAGIEAFKEGKTEVCKL